MKNFIIFFILVFAFIHPVEAAVANQAVAANGPVNNPPPNNPPPILTPPPTTEAFQNQPVATSPPNPSSAVAVTSPPVATSSQQTQTTEILAPAGQPTNAPPPPPNSINAGPPEPLAQPGVAAENVQFQNWLNSSATASNASASQIPPPPLNKQVPPPPHKRIKHKFRAVNIPRGECAPTVESPPMTYAEEKEIMRDMAPPLAIPPDPDSDVAFNRMMQQNMPLTPDQVIKLRQLIDTSQRAAAIPPTIPPKPISTTLMVNLAPGSTPPAIRLAQGYISSLVFVDSTGAPWPVAAYDIGDPKIVNIQWDGKSNIMMMQATSPYSSGNLVIRLVGLETPVTLELVSGQRVVDYRTDIHVPGFGPNTKDLPTGTALPESANQLLLSILDGVAPPGSTQLKVIGGDCQAWLLGDKMYLRTRLTVLSPGWIGKMSSPDGMMAYEMVVASTVLVSQYGNPIGLRIEGL